MFAHGKGRDVPALSFFMLWLIWTAHCDAHRTDHFMVGTGGAHSKLHSGALTVVGTNTTRAESQFLCFGLCILAGGGLIASIISGTVVIGGGTLLLVSGGAKVVEYLSENGITNETISAVVHNASRFASLSDFEGLDQEEMIHKDAVSIVPWTPKDLLLHISQTCDELMEPKGLGKSESSSRSGAVFWNCATPSPHENYGRVLVKGAIREDSSSPEWQLFKKLKDSLGERYSTHTLLNRMLLGFDAFGLHWLVLEDLKASRLLARLQQKLNVEVGASKWSAFDIKPAGSRAPQLPECFQTLRKLATDMGPIKDFIGWNRIKAVLAEDLSFLKDHDVIDESLFVQVAGPFEVDQDSVEAFGKTAVLDVLGQSPMCAYQLKDGRMAIVCVSILDYLLSMSVMKSIQNVFQSSRWDDYDQKMSTMMDCLGDLQGEHCEDYRRQADGEWLEMVKEKFEEQSEYRYFKNAMSRLEDKYRCCCYTQETGGSLTMDTRCAWLRRKDQTTTFGYCPGELYHYSLSDGGCVDLEPPPIPPPPRATRCSWYQDCCCHDLDWMPHQRLPVSENALCSCQSSCPSSYRGYNAYKPEEDYCPEV